MVDVLFIHPGNHEKTYQSLSKEHVAIAPPTWTSLLAGFIRNKGYSVAIHDTNIDGFDAKLELYTYSPKLVVIMVYGHQPSASTQTMSSASIIANKIKKCNELLPIAMGGTHPSALPERTLCEESIDYVIIGEGAYQILDLLEHIIHGKDIDYISGIAYKTEDLVIKNKPALLINDLDKELSDYAFDLLPSLDKYRCHNFHAFGYSSRSPYVVLNTSLGCPYNCNFCCINVLYGKNIIRYWSVETVIRWIDELVNKHQVKHIRFDDELFILDNNRVEKICDELIKRNYNLNIWAYARVDTISERLLHKMKKAGINWICLGIESANKNVCLGVNKKINKDIREVVKNVKDSNINIQGNFMFGLPDDTLDTMQETLDLATNLNCEYINFYCTMPYPGCELYEKNKIYSSIIPETWNGYSQHSYETKPLPTKYISAKEVLNFRDNAFYKYFSNKNYLNMIEDKFGEKVKSEIINMLKIKIKRKILND